MRGLDKHYRSLSELERDLLDPEEEENSFNIVKLNLLKTIK